MLVDSRNITHEYFWDGVGTLHATTGEQVFYVSEKLEKGISEAGMHPEKMNFHLFRYKRNVRYIFVTEHFVDWAGLCNPKERGEKKTIMEVPGALWDVSQRSFIRFNLDQKSPFYSFILYDVGIPHVTLNKEKGQYTIFLLSSKDSQKKQFVKLAPKKDPIFVSYVGQGKRDLEPYTNRIISCIDQFGEKIVLLLRNQLNAIIYKDYVIEKIVRGTTQYNSEDAYFKIIFDKTPSSNDYVEEGTAGYIPNFHLAGGDIVIVKSFLGSQIINMREVPHEEKIIFFKHQEIQRERMTSLVVWYAINDFENAKATYSLEKGQFLP